MKIAKDTKQVMLGNVEIKRIMSGGGYFVAERNLASNQ